MRPVRPRAQNGSPEARFENDTAIATVLGANNWHVRGYYEDPPGTARKSYYSCTISYDEARSRWEVNEFKAGL